MMPPTIDEDREALDDMVHQFAYRTVKGRSPCISTGGLSALEGAFDLLGLNDPHPVPESACDIAGCPKHATCGFPYGRPEAKLKRGRTRRYLSTCSEHYGQYRNAR